MGRSVKDSKLDSSEARSKLKARHEPYWRLISEGLHIGYRKGTRGGVWLGRVRDGTGYRKEVLGKANDVIDSQKQGFLTFAEAQARAGGLLENRALSVTVQVATDHYLDWFRVHRKSVKETENVIQTHILPLLGEIDIVALHSKQIKAWHMKLATKPARKRAKFGVTVAYREAAQGEDAKRSRKSTANRILTVLKAILNKAYEDDLVSSKDAWAKVKPFEDVDEPIVRFLKTDEATRLLNACNPDLRLLVHAALHTGARFSELVGASATDFSIDTASLHIRPGKSGRGRHIPLTNEGSALFASAIVGKKGSEPIFTRADGSLWRKNYQVRPLLDACKKASIEPAIGFHELRHTYASLLAQAGADLLTISKLLGHADTRITSRHYAHLCDKTLANAVNRFLPSFGEPQSSNVTTMKTQRAKQA